MFQAGGSIGAAETRDTSRVSGHEGAVAGAELMVCGDDGAALGAASFGLGGSGVEGWIRQRRFARNGDGSGNGSGGGERESIEDCRRWRKECGRRGLGRKRRRGQS